MSLRLVWLLPVIAALGVLLAWLVFPYQQVDILHQEGAFVEVATVVFYVAAAGLLFARARQAADWRAPVAVGIAMLLFAARELDFHKRFSGNESTLRLSSYTKHAIGLPQVLTLVAVLLLLVCLAWLWHRHGRGLWRRLRAGEPVAVSTVLFFATMGIAKTFDRLHAILYEAGFNPHPASLTLVRSWEEVLEMTLPLIVIGVTLHLGRQPRSLPAAGGRVA